MPVHTEDKRSMLLRLWSTSFKDVEFYDISPRSPIQGTCGSVTSAFDHHLHSPFIINNSIVNKRHKLIFQCQCPQHAGQHNLRA